MRQLTHSIQRGICGVAALALIATGALAEQAARDSEPVSTGSSPVSARRRSVHDGARTIGESSAGSVKSGPISDGNNRSMLSGPMSDVSRGPMTNPRPMLNGGAVTEGSAGPVKYDRADPLGERISQPLHELSALQQRLRELREEAANSAPPVDESAR